MGIQNIYEEASLTRNPRPFVKWAGGKSQLLEQMSEYFPKEFKRYFEPFLGGGAVFFKLKPENAILSDKNYELINAYNVIKDNPESLIEQLEKYQRIQLNRETYNRIRSKVPKDPIMRAARFIFLNKTCYNGLYRVNSKDGFNVPLGGYKKVPRLFDRNTILSISKTLKNTETICDDYEHVLSKAAEGDFIYLDPPYSTNGGGFTDYTSDSFSDNDQENLAKIVKSLHRRGCPIMLSNSNTEHIQRLYSDLKFTIHTLMADRMINCVGSKRKGFSELLITNYTIHNGIATLNNIE